MSGVNAVLAHLQQAAHAVQAIAPLPAEALDKQQGYTLLRQSLAQRTAGGERLSGWKVAFAGRAAQARFGLDEPVYGALTQAMAVAPGSAVACGRLIQPKLEVELALVFGQTLAPGDYSDAQILAAIAEVAPAFEIADCRWQGWQFGLGAFLADNAAAGRYCVGARVPFDATRHACVAYRLEHGGILLGSGDTQAREDSPLFNLCWLVRRLLADGHPVEAGQVVLSGALLAPLAIEPGAYRLHMLGTELALDFHAGIAPAPTSAAVTDD
ncbi:MULTISPECIES: 2-keto-4-pentenoate hydratase [Pseudomonas]|uniref:2-keto-4-pentenoate hydratase n=1 Tax=Pseudomonas TaxID=286 RepID=UPI001AEA79EC|nr:MULTISPECIES: 2-keto-4-pentenoate hydratase [unclassified Pseudomonas]MBP1124769.1 2-keto-4-pentenoate hydratase [Pseudomonas sp. PvP025]MDQ0398629.1 2-keto-4-pentenoate hydratase [Pseudomonas sp. PvP006]